MGYYSIDTYNAVAAFQKKNGIEQTGIAYPQSLLAIENEYLSRRNSYRKDNGEYCLRRLTENFFEVCGENRIIYDPAYYASETEYEQFLESYNHALDYVKLTHPEVNSYLYYLESSRTLDLDIKYDKETDTYILGNDINPISPSYAILRERLHVDGMTHLEITSVDDLFNYFYSTDHHWNHKGSYQGYKDIVELMLGKDEPLIVPAGEHVFPFVFNGSAANKNNLPFSNELFTVYEYDRKPEYVSYINGKKKTYNQSDNYLKGKYVTKTYYNHYGMYYGGDYAKVEFINPKAPDRTLLMIGLSYSNSVKTLLTEHYRNILYIDTRYYSAEYGEHFNIAKAVEEYGVDDILFLFDIEFISALQNTILV